jgi:hypothetical protein
LDISVNLRFETMRVRFEVMGVPSKILECSNVLVKMSECSMCIVCTPTLVHKEGSFTEYRI